MRCLVCGGREFDDWILLDKTLRKVFKMGFSEPVIIEGGAKGADFLSRCWAKVHNVRYEEFPADWKRHGKKAGMVRNHTMLVEGKPDLVVAFPGGRGTEDMVKRALKQGVEVLKIEGNPE